MHLLQTANRLRVLLACLATLAPPCSQCQGRIRWMAGGHYYGPTGLAYSQDGRLIATAQSIEYDDTVKIWFAKSRALIRTFSVPGLGASALSPNGEYLATSETNRPAGLSLWRVSDGVKVFRIYGGGGAAPVFFRDNSRLAVAFSDHVSLYDLSDLGRGEILRIDDHNGGIDLSPDGKLIAIRSESRRNTITIRDSIQGKVIRELKPNPVRQLSRCKFSPDGKYLVAFDDQRLYVWLTKTWMPVGELPLASIYSLDFSFDSRFLFLSSYDELDVLFSFPGLRLQKTFPTDSPTFAFEPTDDSLAIGDFWKPSVASFWSLNATPLGTPLGECSRPPAVAVSLDESTVAGAAYHQINVYDAYTKDVKSRIETLGRVTDVALSPDGSKVVCTHPDQVVMWNSNNGRLLWNNHAGSGSGIVRFSPNGMTVAACVYDSRTRQTSTLCLFDAVDGRLLWRVPIGQGEGRSLAFSPDSRYLIGTTAGSTAVVVRSVDTGRMVLFLPMRTEPMDAIFAPAGDRIVVTESSRVFTLWDFPLATLLGTWNGYQAGVVKRLAVTPDGHTLIAQSADRQQHWDLRYFTYLGQFTSEMSPEVLSFASAGRSFCCGRIDATMVVGNFIN